MNPSMFPQAIPLDYPKIKNIGIATMLDRLYYIDYIYIDQSLDGFIVDYSS